MRRWRKRRRRRRKKKRREKYKDYIGEEEEKRKMGRAETVGGAGGRERSVTEERGKVDKGATLYIHTPANVVAM